MRDLFIDRVKEISKTQNIFIPDSFIGFSASFYELSLKWGQKINITANLEFSDYIIENVIEPFLSFSIFEHNILHKMSPDPVLIDVGCGGGYVGISWAQLGKNKLSIVLLDSDRKKINFCRQVIRDLNVSGVKTELFRVEEFLSLENHSIFDGVLSRATWPPMEFFNKCKSLSKPLGCLLHFSSAQQHDQIDVAKSFLYSLPLDHGLRYLTLFNQ